MAGLGVGIPLKMAEQLAVAGLPPRVPVQSAVLPCMKVMLPLGRITGLATPAGTAFADKVTAWFTTEVCAGEPIVIFAAIMLTVWGRLGATLLA